MLNLVPRFRGLRFRRGFYYLGGRRLFSSASSIAVSNIIIFVLRVLD